MREGENLCLCVRKNVSRNVLNGGSKEDIWIYKHAIWLSDWVTENKSFHLSATNVFVKLSLNCFVVQYI